LKYKPVTKEVSEIGQINFSGNIIPEVWFQAIKHNGKTNVNAALILSEIIWWYRPQEIRDEGTGKLIATSRKFNGDLLQRSHQSFAHKFGITKKQSYDACKLLERLGLIELILIKSMTLPSGDRIGNVLYIRVFPEKIMEITHPLSPPSDRVQPPSDRVQPPSDRVQPPSDRVQPPSDRVQPPSEALSHASGTYTEITTEISAEKTQKKPLSPKGSLSDESGEREISLTLSQESEAQSTEPDKPETKSNPVKQSNPVKDQSSAPRRDPVENARANYDEPPPWRTSWRVGAYSPVFIDFWLDRMIKKFGPRTRTDAIAAIENAEAFGLFGKLQAGWDEFEVSEAKRQATEAAAQTIAQPKPPREPLEEAIARLMGEQGLTPADLLPKVQAEYKAIFVRLPPDPEEAWDCLSQGQLAIVRSFLEKNYAPTP
jgi:hypothetical protein